MRDNIDFLRDPDLEGDETENEGPQVFLLSGYGEPGSSDDTSDSSSHAINRRREWTCWVAAHRPSQKSWNQLDSCGRPVMPQSLIVLEFELERDEYNPLYPPMNTAAASTASGAASPGSSNMTTMDNETPSGATTSRGKPNIARNPSTDGTVSQLGTTSESTLSAHGKPSESTEPTNTESGLLGLDGDDDYYIDPADILESTTSHAKPLHALERMRRMTRTAMANDSGSASAHPDIGSRPDGGRKRNCRTGPGSGGVGTMDVFAVLSQINEQLGNAADLDTFLKVVVGVVKDLTQFHRCLVYSFDAHWNGQVVAELVDWSKTRDLYKVSAAKKSTSSD